MQKKNQKIKKSYYKKHQFRISDKTATRLKKRKKGTWEHTIVTILDKLDEYEKI